MIHYFNPGHETAVLNESPYYMPPSNVALMQQELAFLVAWYANEGDFVFVQDRIEDSFYNYLIENLNFEAQPFSKDDIPNLSSTLTDQKVCLWGISPQAIHIFEEIKGKYTLDIKIPDWTDEYRRLCSRVTAKDILTELIENINGVEKNIIPTVFDNLDEIEKFVANNNYQLIAKAPYSSSGRGLLWLPIGEPTRTERQILHGMLKKQKVIMLESALNKKVDFAMEFMIDEHGKVSYEGLSVFKTNVKGAYTGNFLEDQHSLENKILPYINKSLLLEIKEHIINQIEEKIVPHYQGCIGIDMMVYEKDEQHYIHPCLEINMRYNMGYLCIKLFEKYVDADSLGNFHIDFSPKSCIIFENHKRLTYSSPAVFKNNRITEGYLPLCPINEDSHYHAYITVRKR